MIKISELQVKDIVNTFDGKRLGNVEDIEINLSTGKIESITVANSKMLSFLNKEEDTVIPWYKIKMIGEDVILVEYKGYGSFND
ncbi:YlmC/YmxH family sporulation protein [Pradoshia sp. D12]|uniref:YlmC/YmxH family sporulation protein n=1 Tax=Bacillaceae TaxID=186817 RepID=UPI00111E963B|nr:MULTISPECIES: YlmC/YmxH family sporulation protein [Bacillaceae]QFK70903.1 YlmC/YmxH family sporulation protein [Pradoshia sp. D12]TPF72695.1 YlmC/YmxH family sporulation protein [Bacillus sp. D12]